MSRQQDYLYEMLPFVYRKRDAEQGYPLRALLRVIGEQVNVVENDIARLYDNWFIETCEDWIVPYIGDLVGWRPVQEAGYPGKPTSAAARARNRILAPRREVANTIGFRRRKGTLALLEELADAVAGWPVRAVEFYALLGWTQHLNHLRLGRGRSADLRDGDTLDRIDGPFDALAHTVDVRGAVSRSGRGRYNIPSIGAFIWRLKSFPVTDTPACCIERIGAQYFTFSVLGNDTPLYTLPEREVETTHIAEEINLPTSIRRRAFELRLSERPLKSQASPAYYGETKSVSIGAADWPVRGHKGVIPAENIVPADLSDWRAYRAPRNKVLVDPVRGRMVFPSGQLPRHVWVRYHYGFSADMGGGEYDRPLSQPAGAHIYRVRAKHRQPDEFDTIANAYAQWRHDKGIVDPITGKKPHAAVIEIADSNVYEERLAFHLDEGESLQLRAANRARPVLRLLDYRTDQPDPFSIDGGRGSRFLLDGLLVTGRSIEIAGPGRYRREADEESSYVGGSGNGGNGGNSGNGGQPTPAGDLCDVTIRHCTLVPGWELDCDCEPLRPEDPSLVLRNTDARIRIEHSIIGTIWVIADERRSDPIALSINDSIVDATQDELPALCAGDGRIAFVVLNIARSTVIGGIATHAIELAENAIFLGSLLVARRQFGCVRYCHVPIESRTPRRYHCQPESAMQAIAEVMRQKAAHENTSPDEAAIALAQSRELGRVQPQFGSLRYGMPNYCQLARACANEIARGADDESEMGAFHDLYQPQRAANLRLRLDEYTPAGMNAEMIDVT